MNGNLEWEELGRMQRQIGKAFQMFDKNGDKGLSVDEFIAMRQAQARQRAQAGTSNTGEQ